MRRCALPLPLPLRAALCGLRRYRGLLRCLLAEAPAACVHAGLRREGVAPAVLLSERPGSAASARHEHGLIGHPDTCMLSNFCSSQPLACPCPPSRLHRSAGFLRLVASRLPPPPPVARRRLEAAWAELAARDLPKDMLSAAVANPLEGPCREPGAGSAAGAAEAEAAAGAEPMAVEEGSDSGAGAAEASEVQAAGGGGGSTAEAGAEGEEEACRAIRSSLYRLISCLQPDLQVCSSPSVCSVVGTCALQPGCSHRQPAWQNAPAVWICWFQQP